MLTRVALALGILGAVSVGLACGGSGESGGGNPNPNPDSGRPSGGPDGGAGDTGSSAGPDSGQSNAGPDGGAGNPLADAGVHAGAMPPADGLHGYEGTYAMTYAGTWRNTYPNMLGGAMNATVTVVVRRGTATDLLIQGVVQGAPTANAFCQVTLNWTGEDTATLSPGTQSCTFTPARCGGSQTNTFAGGTATFSRSSPPTLTFAASQDTYRGAGGACGMYGGNGTGTWTGHRQ